jgi:flagellar basal-body rod protein FlgB
VVFKPQKEERKMDKGMFGGLMPVLERGLDVAVARHKVISSNIANDETPGYKTKEINFEQELKKTLDKNTLSMAKTNSSHLNAGGLGGKGIDIRVDKSAQTGLDGNSVSLEKEMVKMAENKLMHDAAMTLLSKKFEGLKSAIIGGR